MRFCRREERSGSAQRAANGGICQAVPLCRRIIRERKIEERLISYLKDFIVEFISLFIIIYER